MIKVTLSHKGNYFSEFFMNISHIREKNTILRLGYWREDASIGTIEQKVYDQFGGYTVGAYSLPLQFVNPPHYANHNRIVISRCSPKDNYDRHKGIMCCIEKIVRHLWPEGGFTLVPQFNNIGRLISADKSIRIDLQ